MSDFKPGDTVLHALFGNGVVAAIAGSGPDARITVDFAPSVGRKKLLASVAHLEPADSNPSSSSGPAASAWFEVLEATLRPRRGRRVDGIHTGDLILTETGKPEFWIAVRERLRSRGQIPKVIDDPNGRVSVSSTGLMTLDVRVQHDSMNDARSAVAARAIFDELFERVLRDFEAPSFVSRSGIQYPLAEEDLVYIEEAELGNLPERSSRMRPKRVTPKGVITSLPKRRDDY
ncbi:MAG: hypothetical protein WCT04_02510 [Planctomycetota bacterium]